MYTIEGRVYKSLQSGGDFPIIYLSMRRPAIEFWCFVRNQPQRFDRGSIQNSDGNDPSIARFTDRDTILMEILVLLILLTD
ncbi:hypothetical protein CS542_04730 [Pedobacter sp. IW39]|nr:hypothetical protein CS542_04730 [Pedobacter sp. IW39]